VSFGAQWLNDWESEKEERLSVPVAHFKTASPTEPIPAPAPAFDFARVVREIVATELGGILAPAWASSLTDRIVAKVLASCEPNRTNF
jgi:hypothetical protein